MRVKVSAVAVAGASLLVPASAQASVGTSIPVADFLGIGHALLGGLDFTAGFFRDLFLALFGGLADMLIPDSWAAKGTEFLTWLVAVPDFTVGAFGDLRHLAAISLWLGLAMLPVTLGVSIGLPVLGLAEASDGPGAIVARTLGATAALILWATLWGEGAALCNTVSESYIRDATAVSGMNAYMELIAVGGLVGGVPFLGILIVLFASLVFLAALVLKVFLLLIGALLFVSGPLLLGLVPTHRGAHLARTWVTALLATWALPVVWGIVFVVSGVLIHRAPVIGTAIGGHGSIASTGGMLIAGCAAIAGPLLCTSLAKSVLGPLGGQLATVTRLASPSVAARRLAGAPGLVTRRNGSLGGSPRAIDSTASGSGGPTAALGRLAQARLGAIAAAKAGAASGRSGGARPPVRRFADVAARGGALAVAATEAGRSVGRLQTGTGSSPSRPRRRHEEEPRGASTRSGAGGTRSSLAPLPATSAARRPQRRTPRGPAAERVPVAAPTRPAARPKQAPTSPATREAGAPKETKRPTPPPRVTGRASSQPSPSTPAGIAGRPAPQGRAPLPPRGNRPARSNETKEPR